MLSKYPSNSATIPINFDYRAIASIGRKHEIFGEKLPFLAHGINHSNCVCVQSVIGNAHAQSWRTKAAENSLQCRK